MLHPDMSVFVDMDTCPVVVCSLEQQPVDGGCSLNSLQTSGLLPLPWAGVSGQCL